MQESSAWNHSTNRACAATQDANNSRFSKVRPFTPYREGTPLTGSVLRIKCWCKSWKNLELERQCHAEWGCYRRFETNVQGTRSSKAFARLCMDESCQWLSNQVQLNIGAWRQERREWFSWWGSVLWCSRTVRSAREVSGDDAVQSLKRHFEKSERSLSDSDTKKSEVIPDCRRGTPAQQYSPQEGTSRAGQYEMTKCSWIFSSARVSISAQFDKLFPHYC